MARDVHEAFLVETDASRPRPHLWLWQNEKRISLAYRDKTKMQYFNPLIVLEGKKPSAWYLHQYLLLSTGSTVSN